jgi:NarL family two-component system response regulator LiaR
MAAAQEEKTRMDNLSLVHVLIVDDHPVVRRGIAFALASFDDVRVVAEAGSGDEAIRLCGLHHPDVVIMDMLMPGMDGTAATRTIKAQFPTTQVVVLTSYQDARLVRDALKAGAIGYLLKDVAIDELALAVRNAAHGQCTLHRAATQALLQPQTARPDLIEELTDRQREILALVVQGLSNQEIARQVYVSLSTVRFHVSTILAKLGAANRAEAAAMAIKYNLLG